MPAFVLLNLLAAMMCLSGAATAQERGSWSAWVDDERPGPRALIVTGTVLAPNPGYRAALVRAGAAGDRLVLDLRLAPRPGVWAQVIDEKTVRYEERPYDGRYRTVVIRSDEGWTRTLTIARAR